MTAVERLLAEDQAGPCPGGCGCRLYSPDADPADCGCASYCTMDTTDWPKWNADAPAYEAAVEALERLYAGPWNEGARADARAALARLRETVPDAD